MIKKIVTLAVGFVFAFVAIFFSVRAEGTADGKGSGNDVAVKNPEEFAEVLTDLPDSAYYEALLPELTTKKDAKTLAAAAEDGSVEDLDLVTPVTLCEKSTLKTDERKSYSGNESRTQSYLRRTLYMYYGKDAVYYDSVGTVFAKNMERRGSTSEDGTTRTTITVTLDFDAHVYIGKNGVFIKFNKWEQTEEVVNETVVKGKFVVDKEDSTDADYNEKAKEEVAKALQKNYGKWISLYGGELSEMPDLDDLENLDPTQMQQAMGNMVEYLAKIVCAEAANQYYKDFMNTNDNNAETFGKYAKMLKAYKEELAFEKSGNMYKMTDLGKQALLKEFGWESEDETRVPSVSSSHFVIDMSDKKAPALFTTIDYDMYRSTGEGDYRTTKDTDFKLNDEITVKHINNTEVPYSPDTKDDMYTLFGDAVKKIITSSMMNTSSLRIDGLNGAMEVIG